ncbi:MAG: FliI/YscN family ATPase [Planctomycetota bacterium]
MSLLAEIPGLMPSGITGSVVRLEGSILAVADLPAPLGAQVEIQRNGHLPGAGEVIGFRGELTLIFPWDELAGIRYGTRVRLVRTSRTVRVGESLLGRVINARGEFLDSRNGVLLGTRVPLDRAPPPAVSRPRIDTALSTGIRAIDGLLTCGLGQRMGIFSGTGVGKSVTLGMMARHTSADVAVIALIGERGREVNEFLERDLGPTGLARSVVVVATSDEAAPLRVRAAWLATAAAEYFRDQGQHVLLVMDSITRFAHAQREIGLAAGEPPTTRGYPPSTFALLPKLVERAGRSALGSITGFYSVLTEGDDPHEPISDTVRGLLDGHTFLSRNLASQGHFPAIEILDSVSRLMPQVTTPEHRVAAAKIRELLAIHRQHADLLSIGAYRSGTNPVVDTAVRLQPDWQRFLRQGTDESSTVPTASAHLQQLAEQLSQTLMATA